MNALAISSVACVIMLGGAFAGMLLRKILPERHLNEHSKDIVRLGSGLIATMSALVLDLLISSAKGNYEIQRDDLRQITAKLVLLDSLLARYGLEARRARELQRQAIPAMIDRMWGERAVQSATDAPYRPSAESELVVAAIEGLSPQNDVQRNLKFRTLQIITAITEARLLLFEQADASLPTPLLAVLVFWLTMLLASFTLFSAINPTNAVALAIIALSASGAIFLILEMNDPFHGLLQVSRAPLRDALGVLGP